MSKTSIVLLAILGLVSFNNPKTPPLTLDTLQGVHYLSQGLKLDTQQDTRPLSHRISVTTPLLYKFTSTCYPFFTLLASQLDDNTFAQHLTYISQKETGGTCDSKTIGHNKNGTIDVGRFQHNCRPTDKACIQTALDSSQAINLAIAKYKAGRKGVNNASAWYAVCHDPHPSRASTIPTPRNGFLGPCK